VSFHVKLAVAAISVGKLEDMRPEKQKSAAAERPDMPAGSPVTGRRATINDIARLANVSKKTVSRVINHSPLVTEETRERVSVIIRQHGYEPDPQARGLAFRRSFLIGLVYDNPNAQFVVTMQQGLLDGVRGSGFELVVHPCNRQSKTLVADVRAFAQRQKLYGVVLLPPISENNALTTMLDELGCRYVRVASAVLDVPAKLVVSNDRIGTAEAARHLAALGHTRIGLIEGPIGFRSRIERREGFEAGLAEHDLRLAKEHCVDGAYTFDSGIEGARKLLSLKNRPTAIFACNDEMAAGVYQVAREMGLSIPEDLSIVGFDDTPVSSRLWPPLTTIRWPIVEMGRSAAAKLLDGAESDVAVPEAKLIVRSSTAPPKR
jgi:LacI family transcriptional regulator